MVNALITLMLMNRSEHLHRNPNLIIAVVILLVTVVAAVFASPAINNRKAGNQDKIVKKMAVKELGVEMSLTDPLKNLKYEAQNRPLGPGAPQRQMAIFSVKEYTDLANKCTGVATNSQVFTTLVKVNGQANKQSGSSVARQLKDYYLVRLNASLPDTDTCKQSKTRPQLEALHKKLNAQFDNALKSAKVL
jgi:hypothetical protein